MHNERVIRVFTTLVHSVKIFYVFVRDFQVPSTSTSVPVYKKTLLVHTYVDLRISSHVSQKCPQNSPTKLFFSSLSLSVLRAPPLKILEKSHVHHKKMCNKRKVL